MSLLNDALRAAEERQKRPEVSTSYTGNYGDTRSSGQRWLLVLTVVLALAVAVAGGYWLLMAGSAPTPDIATQQVIREPVLETPVAASKGSAESGKADVEASATLEEKAPKTATAETESETMSNKLEPAPTTSPEPARVASTESSETAPTPEQVSQPAQATEPERDPEPQLSSSSSAEPAQSSEMPVVKRSVRSPEAIDRQQAKALEALMAEGRFVQAERQLAALVKQQAAPQSRYIVGRALLVEDEVDRALSWLPESVALQDAGVRMLRARALHRDQQLAQAVSLLQTRVPPVAEGVEYRTTLATLLQQQGNVEEAAYHWAELIAWDDTRAPWWVGLAIALEDQGKPKSAVRAYEQAVSLPGLSSSLVDYVQQRLRSLSAG